MRDPPFWAPREDSALAKWRVQNISFWSTSIGAVKEAVLQTAREYALTCTAAATVAHFGTHPALAESERFAGRSLDAPRCSGDWLPGVID